MEKPIAQDSAPAKPPLALWAKRIFAIIALIAIMDLILFAAAGTLDWPEAWLWTILYGIFLFVFLVWGMRNAPELLEERGQMKPNVKRWDKALLSIYSVLLVAELIIAGADSGRSLSAPVPIGIECLALLGLMLAGGLIFWTTTANAFLSRFARIQEDRNQKVATEGPYRFVRHPMYLGIQLLFLLLPLALGSWWALIPGALIALVYLIRTMLEDRMLRKELAGYAEYAKKVKFRLYPGIW